MPDVKVAAVAFTVTNDLAANLGIMLGYIDDAAANGARLVHFAEFCNHPTWYRDQDHCWQSALDWPDDAFIRTIQDRAAHHRLFVGFNATVKGEYPMVFDQNHLVGPDGRMLATTQKQILMYIEQDFYTPAQRGSVVVDTEIGRIGMYSCMDGLIPETTRVLTLRGAQVLLNSLASNALDEAHTHIPARAAENRVWIIAANRAGPIVDESEMATLEAVSGIPHDLLIAGAEPQVVAPDGTPLVRGEPRVDGIVYATIQPELADDKSIAGRGDLIRDRRPDAYGLLTTPNDAIPATRPHRPPPAAEVHAVAFQLSREPSPAGSVESLLQTARRAVRLARADLVVFPELFCFSREALREDVRLAARDSERAVIALADVAREMNCLIATSLVERDADRSWHTGWLLGPQGVVGSYRQVHVHPDDRGWALPGEAFAAWETPIGCVGMMLGYDGCFPESARVLARLGADVIVYPTTWRDAAEVQLGVIERASENHVGLVVAARSDSPLAAPSTIIALSHEYKFPITGEVNMPDRFDAPGGNGQHVSAVLDLTLSRDKKLMGRTDLLSDARPDLYEILTALPARVARA